MMSTSQPTREDVLDAFAVEPNVNRETLERYLRDYPEHTAALLDLSRELSRDVCDDEDSLPAEAQAAIDQAWRQHMEAAPEVSADPFSTLSVTAVREIAHALEVPRQVISAFRERRVLVDSVPQRFLARLARALNSSVDSLVKALSMPPGPAAVRSFKSNVKPDTGAPVPFERLLVEAGIPDDKRRALMADD